MRLEWNDRYYYTHMYACTLAHISVHITVHALDTVVVADSERKLCQLVTEFERVCVEGSYE